MSDNLQKYEKTTATVGVTTLATIPSGKAMKGRLMLRGISGAASILILSVNGCEVCRLTGAVGDIIHSTSAAQLNKVLAATGAAGIDGSADAKTVAPGPREFILKAGDTVTYEIQTAAYSSMYAAFEGVELDAS